MDSQIRALGYVRIQACLKHVYVLQICEDLLDLWNKAESLEVQVSNPIHKSESLRIGLPNPD